jgi:predicted ATPase
VRSADIPTLEGRSVRFLSLRLTNFLSYRSAVLEFGDFTALVGPNGSGKSNAVAAIKLLRDIPTHGLPVALARRGGFDQLRHRDTAEPSDPTIRLEFRIGDEATSHYELHLRSIGKQRYEARESASINADRGKAYNFASLSGHSARGESHILTPPGQSALPFGRKAAVFMTATILQAMQALELSPARVGELQEPSSTQELEPDGSNIASIVEDMPTERRAELTELLATVVPGITGVEARHVADKITVAFLQDTGHGTREFFAKQMSDGTLRAFGILVALLKEPRPTLLVVEEPETAIHLGALHTLVEALKAHNENTQTVITTHSADIVDRLALDDLRVVWSENGESKPHRARSSTSGRPGNHA